MNNNVYSTRLCLSGVESRRLLDTFSEFQVPHIQASYYYLNRVFGNPSECIEYLSKFETVLIDSGLIYHKYKSEEEKEQFLKEYALYVASIDPAVYTACVTHPTIDLARFIDEKKLIYPLDDLEETFEGDVKSIFEQVEYIGLSNKVANNEERMGFISSQAEKHSNLLHAFGTSSIRVLKRWPIYTANSSSWRTGSRYANTYLYEGSCRGLRIYQPTDKSDLTKTDREKRQIRTRLKHLVESRQANIGGLIDWGGLIEGDDSWEVDKANLTQWILYQRDLELDIGRNKYWLTDKDKDLLRIRRQEVLGRTTPSARSEEGKDREDPTLDLTPRKNVENDIELRNIAPPNNAGSDNEVVEGVVEEQALIKKVQPVLEPTLKAERVTELDPRITAPRKCDNCILADRCPKYQPGAPCAFGLTESYLPVDIDDHINEDVADLMAIQKDRILQAYLEEKTDASGINRDLGKEIQRYLELVQLYRESNSDSFSASIKARGSRSTGLLEMFNKRG